MIKLTKVMIILFMLIWVGPVIAQDNSGEIPVITIPVAEDDSQLATLERYESGGFRIHVALDGDYMTWIGQSGNQIFFDSLTSIDGVIDLPANNVWLMNGNYVFWLCPSECELVTNWIGPIPLTVDDAQAPNLSSFDIINRNSSDPRSFNLSAHWMDSDVNSWYHITVNLLSDENTVRFVAFDTWIRGSEYCSFSFCNFHLPHRIIATSEDRYLTIQISGWGAGGMNAQSNSETFRLPEPPTPVETQPPNVGCPPGMIEFPPGVGFCVGPPGG